MTVAWKRGLPKPKLPCENLSPLPSQKSQKKFVRRKSHWGSWSFWRSSIKGFSLAFSVMDFSLGVPVKEFSLGFSVIDSSSSVFDSFFGSPVLFSRYAPIFFIKACYLFFFIKRRCCILHYIFKKTFTLNNSFNVF